MESGGVAAKEFKCGRAILCPDDGNCHRFKLQLAFETMMGCDPILSELRRLWRVPSMVVLFKVRVLH